MSTNGRGGPVPSEVDPLRLTMLLEQAGWQLVGGRRNAYNRLAPPSDPSGRSRTLVVPLDRAAPEFAEMMDDALSNAALGEDAEAWRSRILPRLATSLTDEYRFRKEGGAPTGLIPWRDGEALIQAARATLIAGAKALLSKSRHFGNRHGQFAGRYLDAVLMGQTAPGSYVVTAFAPSEDSIAIHQRSDQTLGVPGIDYVQGRDVSTSVVGALKATLEALDHFRSTKSMSGFDAGVEYGVSYELASALVVLTADADEADISVEWHPTGDTETVSDIDFTFTARDTSVLQKAASRLVIREPMPRTVVEGRVHLLTKKEAGLPGVIGVVAPGTSQPKRVRVHLLDASDYHLAVRAHDEDLIVRVVGDLQRDGNLNWLYGARIDAVMESPEPPPSHPLMEDVMLPGFDVDEDT